MVMKMQAELSGSLRMCHQLGLAQMYRRLGTREGHLELWVNALKEN